MRKLVAVAVGSMLAVSACGGGEEAASQASGGLTSVNVGLIPTVDVAPLYLAQERGLFEEHGLKVEFKEVQTGAAAMAAVMSNEYQFGFAAPAPQIQARAKGLQITVVAGAISQGEALSQAVVVAPGSPVQDITDLEGKTVAVNALQGINDLVVRALVKEAGGDHTKLNFIALPYPDMQAALDSGQIDAAWLIEPFLVGAVEAGNRVISKNPQGELSGPNTNFSSYFAADKFVNENPETVQKFVDAVTEANEYAEANPEAVRGIIPTYTAIKPEVAKKMAIGRFITKVDEPTFEVVGSYMKEFGWINEAPDLDALIYKP